MSVLQQRVLALLEQLTTFMHGSPSNPFRVTRQMENGGYSDIRINMPELRKEELPLEIVEALKLLHEEIAGKKNIPFDDFQASILNELRDNFIKSAVFGVDSRFLITAAADAISSWATLEDSYYVDVRFLTQLPPQYIGNWQVRELDVVERTLIALRSGLDPSSYLDRLSASTTVRSILPPNQSKMDLIKEVDYFLLALSYALWRPLHLEDITLRNRVWQNCLAVPFRLARMWGAYDYSTRDVSAVSFLSNGDPFFQQQIVDRNVYDHYYSFFRDYPEVYSPCRKIMKGLWKVLSAVNKIDYGLSPQDLDSILDILIGMDGLIGKTPERYGNRRYFRDMWTLLLSDWPKAFNPKAKKASTVLDRLYDLRCELAHGSYLSVGKSAWKAISALGFSIDEGMITESVVGRILNELLKSTFLCIRNDPSLWRRFKVQQSTAKASRQSVWRRLKVRR